MLGPNPCFIQPSQVSQSPPLRLPPPAFDGLNSILSELFWCSERDEHRPKSDQKKWAANHIADQDSLACDPPSLAEMGRYIGITVEVMGHG